MGHPSERVALERRAGVCLQDYEIAALTIALGSGRMRVLATVGPIAVQSGRAETQVRAPVSSMAPAEMIVDQFFAEDPVDSQV